MEKYENIFYSTVWLEDRSSFTELMMKEDLEIPVSWISMKPYHQGRTVLHVAAERGHKRIVPDLLEIWPDLAKVGDLKGVLPIHLASEKGHLEVVNCLLVGQNAYLLKDYEGNTPLHWAANNDHIEVLKLLISKLTVGEFVGEKRTGNLQRCVIRSGCETLNQMIEADPNFLNGFDNEDHDTLLHTATLLCKPEMVRYLVGRDDVLIAKNKKGLTALDIINMRSRESDDDDTKEIRTLLKRHTDEWEHKTGNFYENKRGYILAGATIIIALAYQVGVNPPGGVLQENKYSLGGDLIAPIGTSVMAFTEPDQYVMFSYATNLAYVCSTCIIALLMSGVRLNRTIFMWLLSVGMWVAITSMGYTYFEAQKFITPTKVPGLKKNQLFFSRIVSMTIGGGLMGFIPLARVNHYTKLLIKKRRDSNFLRWNHAQNVNNENGAAV